MTLRRFLRALVPIAVTLLALLPSAVSAATLVADYRFEGTLKNSVAGAPELALEGVTSASFRTATNLLGSNRPVLELPISGGLRLDTSGLVASNQYTVVLLVAESPSSVAGSLRILDTREPTLGQGWFTQGGIMIFHPATSTGPIVILPEQFIQLTLVKSGDQVRAYADRVKQFELTDSGDWVRIGDNGIVHFFRQADGQFAGGVRVARIRVYNGALTDAEVAALAPAVPVAPVPASGAAVVADYRFESSLKSSVSGAPDLSVEGANNMAFVPDTVLGTNRTVLDFAVGGGVRLDASGLVAAGHLNRDRYTMVALFELNDVGTDRILDARDTPDTLGLFFQTGKLWINGYPAATAGGVIAHQYTQIVLSDDGQYVRAYQDGVKVLDLIDTQDIAALGANQILNFFRQSNGAYAPGGRVARIRLFDGALTEAEVAALTPVVPVAPVPASGAAVVADYRFESSLKSSVAGAPDLSVEGANNMAFVPDTVFGTNRTVLDFAGGGGLRLDATGLVAAGQLKRDRYTMVALFELNDVSTDRILDARDNPDTLGFFFQAGKLWINSYPAATAGGVIAHQYTQIALVDDGQYVRAYQDGVKVLDLIDTQDIAALGANEILNFFRQSNGAYAPGGRVARIRLFDGALTEAEVAALTPLAATVATIPPSGAAVVADYRFERSLKSSVGIAPDLTVEGQNFAAFVSDSVAGSNRTVLDFAGGGGVRLNAGGLVASGQLKRDRYTMVALFELNDVSTDRILDARDNPDTLGLFFQAGKLWINSYPAATAGGVVAHQYVQIALVNDGQFVRAYQDGVKVLDLIDTQDLAVFGSNSVLNFFRQSNGAYGPGGRVARIRLFDGALTDAEVAALTPLVAPALVPPSGSQLVADYQFHDTFASSIAGAPAIEPTALDQVSFVDAPDLTGRRVLKFAGGQGLTLATSGLIDPDHYSMVIAFAFDSVGSYTRLLDPQDPSATTAWFLLNGTLGYHPFFFTPNPVLASGEFGEMTVVYDGGQLRAYAGREKQFELLDPSHAGSIGTNGSVSFFRNFSNGAYAPGGRVTRIRIYNGALNDADLSVLVPSVPGADLASIPAGANVALDFNGGYLEVANNQSLTAPYTVEFWGLPTAGGGSLGVLGSRQPSDGSFDLKFSGTSGLHSDIGTGGSWLTTGADYTFPQPVTNWIHVAYIVRSDSYEIVVNGQSVATGTYTAALPLLYDATHLLRIGATGYSGELMQGQLDEVRVWKVARTPAQIAEDYKKILQGTEPGLVNYYRFSEGNGRSTVDSALAGRASRATFVSTVASVRWVATGPELETNNSVSLPVDLVIRSVQAPTTLVPGQLVNITYTVANEGAAPAVGPWTDAVFVSPSTNGSTGFLVGTFLITNTLPPNSTLTFTQKVAVPINGPGGKLYFGVTADAADAVAETSESNNTLFEQTGVTIPGILTLALAAVQVREDASGLAASVTRNGDFSKDLTVTLTSGDPAHVTVPSSVLIPAGRATAEFQLKPKPDGQVTGPLLINLSAQATGFQATQVPFTVLDLDLPSLGLVLSPARIIEGASSSLMVTRPGSTLAPLTVNIAGPLGQLNFPASVVIAAGQSKSVFNIDSVDNTTPQLSRTNAFTVSSEGYLTAAATLVVDDNDVPNLRITLANRTVSEGAGPQATTGTITRDRPSPRALTVLLFSGKPQFAQVPASITIAPGATNAIFNIAVTDNLLVDGNRNVVIGATLIDPGTQIILADAAPDVLTITDDDGPSLRLDLAADAVGVGLNPATTGTVTRNAGTNTALVVQLTSGTASQATVPTSVTIPKGAFSTSFPIATLASGGNLGSQSVVLNASAIGFTSSTKTLVVTDARLPDLVVASLRSPASVMSDSPFNITFRIENRGLVASGTNFVQRILLSTDSLPSSEDVVLFENTFEGSIPGGQFIEQTVQVRSPRLPGDYSIIVVTDADNAIAELSENNNSLVSPQVLQVQKAYRATVFADTQVAPPNTPIGLTGKATLTVGNLGAPFVVVELTIRVRDTERQIAALTDLGGNYHATFQPLPGEGGSYTVSADYPGITNSPVQATFSLIGLSVDRISGGAHLVEGASASLTTLVHNLANLPLTQLSASVVSKPSGIAVTASVSSATLSGDGTNTLVLGIAAANGAQAGNAVIRLTSAEGATTDLTLPIAVELARPRLIATPGTIESGMRRGGQSTVQVGVTNLGGLTTGPLTVLAPPAPWLKISSGTLIPPLAPGEGALVSLLLTPAADLDLGPYTGSLVINASNASVSVPFTFRNLSESFGNLVIETVDEYTYYAAGSPKLTNAAVRILDSITKDLVLTNRTGADGTLRVPNLKEAYYDLEVTAEGHSSFRATVLVDAAKDKQVTAFLSRQTVKYLFTVVPTEIEDRTRIVITTTFETFVPIPVVTADPPYFDLSGFSGSVTQVNLTLKNHGLLAANNVRLRLPEDSDVIFSSIVSQIGVLPAQSSLTVPIIIRKASSVNSGSAAKARVAKPAAGGGSCYHDLSFDFDLVCGPQVNTYNIPVRFDLIPGCAQPSYGLGGFGEYIPTWTSGGQGPGGTDVTCPFCNDGARPVLFLPPSLITPPENCDPCIVGVGISLVKCVKLLPPIKAVNCIAEIAQCAAGLAKGYVGNSGYGDAALGCFGNITKCVKGGTVGTLASIPDCLSPLSACFGGSGGGGGGSSAGRATPAGLRGAKPAADSLPSEVQPLFRQVDRAVALIAPLTNWFGSAVWLAEVNDDHWTNWFSAFSAAVETTSPSGQQLTDAEIVQLLSLPAPSAAVTGDDVRRFAARWNRSIDYYHRSIFTVAQVPAGQSTDFVAADVQGALGAAAVAANEAAIADGYNDPFTAVYQVGKEFLARANSAGGGICAHVKLRIEQEAVITRDAFNASLEIDNDTDAALTDIFVELVVRATTGEDVTRLFAIRAPSLAGLSAVNGSGIIAAKSSGKASWILIPTSEAAPDGPVTHVIGGTLRYQQDGVLITVPLVPASINVLPNASLALKYFHQRDVFADDPFTDEIEPSIPYSLAVMIQNSGKGAARNVRIASAQPKIIENKKGLLIDFSIIATEVAGQSLTPSLTANFGDINPGEIKIGRWLLKSSLQGLFTEYSATFENLDGLGDKRLSLIQSVEIHELNHIVQADRTFEDGKPDFLANDVPDFDANPDTLHLSQGTNLPVALVTNAVASGPVSAGQLTITLTAAMPASWGYLRVPDPADGSFRLKEVRRADNSVVALGTNVWLTDRTFIGFSQKPVRENTLHLLDFKGSGPYRLTYEPLAPADTLPPTSAVAALPAKSTVNIPVSWAGDDGAVGSGIAYYDIYASVNGGAFAPWRTKTSENGSLYPGQIGNSYAFYSVATDFAGNQQVPPVTPDAQTTVSVVNTAPELTVAVTQTANEGDVVAFANAAVDHDVPANTLTWSLGADSPAAARIDPGTGAVSWPTTEATGPSTNQFTLIVRDNGQPSLSVTGRVAVIVREINAAPVLEGITNRTLNELKTVSFQARASDSDLPTNQLTYSLLSAPAGASITATGRFSWTPNRLQGPSTNRVVVQVKDDGVPALSATQSFSVIVRDSEGDFDLSVGSIAVRLGPQLSTSLSLNSGLDLTSINFDLAASSDRLHGLTIQPLIPELALATITPDGPTQFHVHLVASSGNLLQGNRAMASLSFNPGASVHSEIVDLSVENLTAKRSSGELVPNARGIDGRLVLIGLEPLLIADPTVPVVLHLYGLPGHRYDLEQTSDLNFPPPWQLVVNYLQTNLLHTFPITSDAPHLDYHLRER